MLGSGPNAGKIATIVNVIDQNRVLIDGPTSGVSRQEWRIKELQLTPLAIKIPFNSPTKVVRSELVANKVDEAWAASSWSKRMVLKKKRAGLTDLDRFKLRKAKSARNKILAKAVNQKKKEINRKLNR
jgi:large subunit ribosomal protein L14e